jgi:NAD(P)-dependent dehydrogenase (short-subunit alcohol dehydrogenase family)
MGILEDRAQLDGRRAILVGGGGGLGEASAVDLASAGVRVAICDRDAAALEATTRVIEEAGGEVAASGVLDGRDAEALAGFFATADEVFDGQLDILVNVVGGTFRAPFTESSPKAWDALMRTNFTWLLSSHQLAISRMRAAGRGSIINFTSIEAHRAAPGFAVYAAMKAAVASLTSTLAVELGPDGIRVNAIAPDVTPTPSMLTIPGGGPESEAERAARSLAAQITFPMGREGLYEDIGGVVLFLASELSSYVTGTTIHPDGGSWASKGWSNWPDIGFRNLPPEQIIDLLLEQPS